MKIKHILLALLPLSIIMLGCLNAHAYEIQPEQNTKLLNKTQYSQVAMSTSEMVVTAHPLATAAAQDILAKGGNAADAAIAAQLVLGLVEPQSSGLGGGGFALYYQANTNKLYTLDARETAPQSADEKMFLNVNGAPLDFFSASTSKKSIGIPAIPTLLFTLSQEFGTKSLWKESFERAISLSSLGFDITPRLADSVEKHKDRLMKNRSYLYFTNERGTQIQTGDRLINQDYAKTLKDFRDIGPKTISPHYELKSRENLCGTYRSYTICSMPEPSSGGLTLLSILRMIEPYDLGSAPNAEAYHLYLEASKLAFADRNQYMADADFVDTPGKSLIQPEYLAQRRALINPAGANPAPSYGTPLNWGDAAKPDHSGPEEGGTTHISIVDKFGNAASLTSSIEFAFGSGYMKNGYFLNNQLTDFSFIAEKDGQKVANRVQAGKRPRSSMSPVIVFDQSNKPILIIGSAGGSRIIGYVAQRLISILDWHIPAAQALAMPSILARSTAVEAENGFDPKILKQLQAKGHNISQAPLNSGLTLIHYQDGRYIGAADPRREGTASGR